MHDALPHRCMLGNTCIPASPAIRPRPPPCVPVHRPVATVHNHQLIPGHQMDRFSVLLCLMVVTLVQGQEDQLDREGKKLVLKKVRKLRPEAELGQCPEVSWESLGGL